MHPSDREARDAVKQQQNLREHQEQVVHLPQDASTEGRKKFTRTQCGLKDLKTLLDWRREKKPVESYGCNGAEQPIELRGHHLGSEEEVSHQQSQRDHSIPLYSLTRSQRGQFPTPTRSWEWVDMSRYGWFWLKGKLEFPWGWSLMDSDQSTCSAGDVKGLLHMG